MHISITTGENEVKKVVLVFGLDQYKLRVLFSGSICWMSQTKSEPVNKDLIQKCRFCCHHTDISRKLQQEIETLPPKCWQQFICAIAMCWKCVSQVRRYEPAIVCYHSDVILKGLFIKDEMDLARTDKKLVVILFFLSRSDLLWSM